MVHFLIRKWYTFKLVYTIYLYSYILMISCDLLEISYLCGRINNCCISLVMMRQL